MKMYINILLLLVLRALTLVILIFHFEFVVWNLLKLGLTTFYF